MGAPVTTHHFSPALRAADPSSGMAGARDLALKARAAVHTALFDREALGEVPLACAVSSRFLLIAGKASVVASAPASRSLLDVADFDFTVDW